jgi:hypothetical protein
MTEADNINPLLRKEALAIGADMGLVDGNIVGLIDYSDCSFGTDGKPVGVQEALIALRKAKPHFFGLPSYNANKMTPAEQIRVLKEIKARDEARAAKRLAAPTLKARLARARRTYRLPNTGRP